MAQWLIIRRPMQGAWVQALIWEDPTCLRAAAAESALWNLRATTTETRVPRAHAPRQEKQPQ